MGLGVLRSAPAVGALLAGIILTRRPLRGRTGTTLLVVVAAFGVSMVVFGLSKTLWLSVAALAVSGFVDMISMNIRSTIAAVAAPDELRGRVNAVESVFISASNELGAFESGVAAALLGAVPAVVIGGVATIVLAGVWRWVFPDLATIDRIDELRPSLGRRMPGGRPVGFRALASVRIPPILRPEAGGNRMVEVDGATVREVIDTLIATYPSLRERLLDGDELPQFLNVFIDGTDVRLLSGLDTEVGEGATVILLPAVAGGAGSHLPQ